MKSPCELMEEARAATGLSDFGEETFREGLNILVRALNDEARLNAVGEGILHQRIITHLKQRLQVEDWYRRHPEINDEPVVAPLVGIGLPRTGSTACQFLLAQDPNRRYLRRWESMEPCPPPSTVQGLDPRLSREMDALRSGVYGKATVPRSLDGPMECLDLMALDFRCYTFTSFARIPSYADWLLATDFTSTYRYERRVLKLLQWGLPRKRWLLKCPNHLIYLSQFDRVFPDARYVMTHRDPSDVIVSIAQVYVAVASKASDQADPRYAAALNVKAWSVGMQRAMAYRDKIGDARFYDIGFHAMQSDPIGEIKGLYKWLGEEVTAEFESNMARWSKQNAEAREPSSHANPADFGIDLDSVRPLFAEYTKRAAVWTRSPAEFCADAL